VKHTTLKNALFLALSLSALSLLNGCDNAEQQGSGGGFPAPAVSVADVIVRQIIPWKEFSGRIEAKEVVNIQPRVEGVIETVEYTEGTTVNKGDLLFTIDPQPFQAELNRAKAELARANAQADLAHSEIRRAKNLLKRKLLSQDQFDQRIAAENIANASVQSAKASAQLAQLDLGYTKIRSPITGRIGRALVTKGNLVFSNPNPDLLTTIFSFDPAYVVFDSDELTYLRYFGNAKQSSTQIKRTVFIGLGNEKGFSRQGYVDFIDNQVSPDTGTIRLRAVLDNKDHQLIPGLYTRVKLLASQSTQAILIDDAAIITDQDRKFVYVLGEENHAVRRDINPGRSIDGFRVIDSGLEPGDKVIVHGIQKVFFPNMVVQPQPIKMGDSAPSPAPAAEH